MNRSRILARALLATSLLVAAPAAATTVARLSEAEMVKRCKVVAHGWVESIAVDWNEKHTYPRTLITVRVGEEVKGARTGDRLHIYQVGGRVPGQVTTIPGASEWEPGEEVVVFLTPWHDYLVEIGVGTGKYHVETVDEGVREVRRSTSGLFFVDVDDEGNMQPTEPPPPTREPLGTFLQRLRGYLDN